MVKQYITTLKNGAREQKAHILGRNITLRDGEVVSEGILTKTFPSLFEEIVDVSIHAEAPEEAVEEAEAPEEAVEAEAEAPEEAVEEAEAPEEAVEAEAEAPETMLTEDSSDVQGVVEEAEAPEEAVITKSNSKRATKATKATKAK